jgi:Holliday junction resolvase
MRAKSKGYRVERKIKIKLEENGWVVIRSGGSFGEADLVCLKEGKCFFLQIKSTRKDKLYYYGYMGEKLKGFPFFVLVDFGYGDIEVFKPAQVLEKGKGIPLEEFLSNKDLYLNTK